MAQIEFKENQTHKKSFERMVLYICLGGIVLSLLAAHVF